MFTSLVPQTRALLFIVAGFIVKKSKLIYMVADSKNVMRRFGDKVIVL